MRSFVAPKQVVALMTVAALSLGLSGCIIVTETEHRQSSSEVADKEQRNRQIIASLQESTSVATVEAELGVPEFSDLVTRDGERYRVLYYRTQRVHADGNTTRDECTPLVFKDGQLIGTGELAVAQIPTNN